MYYQQYRYIILKGGRTKKRPWKCEKIAVLWIFSLKNITFTKNMRNNGNSNWNHHQNEK